MNNFQGKITKFTGFVKGDIFTVSPELPVINDLVDGRIVVQHTPVVNQYGEPRKLYPSQFCRNYRTKDNKRVRSTGSAVEAFQSYSTIAEAMDALRGKKIQVSDVIQVELPTGLVKTVYSFDFV